MPQIQILGKEEAQLRESAADRAQKRAEMIQNAQYKADMMKYYADTLKLEAKKTDDEAQKIRLQHKIALYEHSQKALEWVSKGSDPKQRMGIVMKTQPDLLLDAAGDPDFQKSVDAMQPDADAQLKGSQSGVLQNVMKYGSPVAPQEPPVGGASMGAPGQVSRATAVGGGDSWEMPEIQTGVGNIVNANAMGRVEAAKKRAGNLEDIKKAAAPGLGILDNLEASWEDAFSDRTDYGPQLGKGIAGKWGQVMQTPQGVKQASYMQTAKSQMSLLVRSLGERGVLTDRDIERVFKAVPMDFTSKALAKSNWSKIRATIDAAQERYNREGPIQNILNSKNATPVLTSGTPSRKYQVQQIGE